VYVAQKELTQETKSLDFATEEGSEHYVSIGFWQNVNTAEVLAVTLCPPRIAFLVIEGG